MITAFTTLYLALALCGDAACHSQQIHIVEAWDGVTVKDRNECKGMARVLAQQLLGEGLAPDEFRIKCASQSQIERDGI